MLNTILCGKHRCMDMLRHYGLLHDIIEEKIVGGKNNRKSKARANR